MADRISMPSKLKICVCGNIEGTAVDDCERCKLLSIIDEQREQIQKLQSLPIFDVLPRLWAAGYTTKEHDGEWHLFDNQGEGVLAAPSFRLLCLNILLMEL